MSPKEPRCDLECVALNDRVYLWGGTSPDGAEFYSRNQIYVYSLTAGTWEQFLASGEVPPPCCRARCEVIGDTIFTYGGKLADGSRSMEMYRLHSDTLIWSKQAIDRTSEKPFGRSSCCFVALPPEKLLLFGGYGPDPGLEIQQGATWIPESEYEFGFNNELYLFTISGTVFSVEHACTWYYVDEIGSKWESIDIVGTRPEPCCSAAMAPIDDHRVLLYGGHGSRTFHDLFMLDIEKRV